VSQKATYATKKEKLTFLASHNAWCGSCVSRIIDLWSGKGKASYKGLN